jgi:EAL domain-containing protein (putative c-di-GMP-specific phosphodiesterase class I)
MSDSVFQVEKVTSVSELVEVYAFFRKGVQTEIQRELLKRYQIAERGLLPSPLPHCILFVRSRNRRVVGAAALMLEHCPQRGIVGTIRFHTKVKDVTCYEELRTTLLAKACKELFDMGAQSIVLELERIANMALLTHIGRAGFKGKESIKAFRYRRPLEEG